MPRIFEDRFSGKAALITGAASGVGLAVARRMAEEGAAHLVLMDIDRPRLLTAMTQLGRDGLALDAISGDIGQPEFWEAHRDRIVGIDYAVANSGSAPVTPIPDLEYDVWRRAMSTNLDGTFLTLQNGFRAMVEKGQGGAMVVVGSVTGGRAVEGLAALGTSKAALEHLGRVTAKEGARHRIRVNNVISSGIQTPLWREWDYFANLVEDMGSEALAVEELGRMHPLRRFSTADEIAGHILYLLSDDAATVTGTNFLADSGYSL